MSDVLYQKKLFVWYKYLNLIASNSVYIQKDCRCGISSIAQHSNKGVEKYFITNQQDGISCFTMPVNRLVVRGRGK